MTGMTLALLALAIGGEPERMLLSDGRVATVQDGVVVSIAGDTAPIELGPPPADMLGFEWRDNILHKDGVRLGTWHPGTSTFIAMDGHVYRCKDGEWVDETPAKPAREPGEDALDEVNAYRARRGLRPFIRDPGLTIAALGAARARAASLLFGHTGNDFQFLPAGVTASAAGCAAYADSFGWMSCCADDNYTFAGAAWVRGRDGKRYMHLFVRGGGRTDAGGASAAVAGSGWTDSAPGGSRSWAVAEAPPRFVQQSPMQVCRT